MKALETIKNLWDNERSRASISLVLWILFFVIAFAILKMDKKKEEPEEVYTKTFDNYEYKLNIAINNTTYNFKGMRKGENEVVDLLNKKYTDVSNIKELYGLDLRYIRMEVIKTFLAEQAKSRIEYNDGSVKETYELTLDQFKINDLDKYEGNALIYMEVKHKNDEISNVFIDLTNKMKLVNNKITSYKIDMTYENIGNIKDISVE